MRRNHTTPTLLALLAALLFGASAPFAKLLLGQMEPILLAACLYLGSGFGLLVIKAFGKITRWPENTEARIQRTDLVWLAGAILTGGIAAPIVLLFGLRNTPAATASLLLNFEAVATTLIAALAFRESVSRRAWWAMIAITLASIALSVNINSEWGFSLGAAGVLAACVLWGMDNNLTRSISSRDPVSIVIVKGLVAGTCSFGLAMATRTQLPGARIVLGAMILGSLCYGLSIVLFVRAMRGLGAARTSALFGTAPLAGVALSLVLFQETLSLMFVLAIPLAVAGAMFLVYEEHSHSHVHESTAHDHSHEHNDEHHEHQHDDPEEHARKHSHPHEHVRRDHHHHHLPDEHHRHTHPAVRKTRVKTHPG